MDIKTSMLAGAVLLLIAGTLIIAISAYSRAAKGDSRAVTAMLKDGVMITAFVLLGVGSGLTIAIFAVFDATKITH